MQRIQMQMEGDVETPYIAGTEIQVTSVLALLEQGWSFQNIRLICYPELTPEDIRACVLYAERCPKGGALQLACEAAEQTQYRPGFFVEYAMPLVFTALLAALSLVYFRATSPAAATGAQVSARPPVAKRSPGRLAAPLERQGAPANELASVADAQNADREAPGAGSANAAVNPGVSPAYHKQMRFTAAEAQYLHAAVANPTDPTTHYDLGVLLSAQGRYIDARTEFTLALALKPEDADFRYGLGKVYCNLRLFNEAIPQFEHALRIDPAHARAQQSLDYCQKMLLRADEAAAMRP